MTNKSLTPIIAATDTSAHGFTNQREHYGILWRPFRARTRFLLLILVMLCMTITWSSLLTLNFTITCMEDKYSPNISSLDFIQSFANFLVNDSSDPAVLTKGVAKLSSRDKYFARAMVAVAVLITKVPITMAINKYGPRYPFAILGIFGGIATALNTVVIDAGLLWALLMCRAVQGAALASNMAAMGSFMAHWTYYKQKVLCAAILMAYEQVAPIFTYAVSGPICSSGLAWRSINYLHALLTVILFFLFFSFYRNRPITHRKVGVLEIRKISSGRDLTISSLPLPYKHILSSMPFWATLLGSLGYFSGAVLIYFGAPVFFNKILGFPTITAGFLTIVPFFALVIGKQFVLFIKLDFISATAQAKLFNSVALFGMAACLAGLRFIHDRYIAVLVLTVGMMLLACNISGFYKSAAQISRRHAPFIVAQCSNGMTFAILLVPTILYFLNENDTPAEWRNVFLAVASVMTACNVFFLVFGSAETQYWAQDDFNPATWRLDSNKTLAGSIASKPAIGKQRVFPVGKE